MPNEVAALVRGEELQGERDELDDLVEAAGASGPQERLELGKRELNRVEIGAVWRQETDPRPGAFNGGLHRRLFVDGEVVEDDDIAAPERRHEHLLDVREERRVVEGAVKDRWRGEALHAQGRDHRVGLPVPTRGMVPEPCPARAPTIPPQEIGGDAGLIHKDIAAGVVERLGGAPAPARGGDIRATLFVGVYRFF